VGHNEAKLEQSWYIECAHTMGSHSVHTFNIPRLFYVEIKYQLDATDGFFIADIIACSTCFGHHYAHHKELKSFIQVVAACGIWCFGFQVADLV